MRRSPFTPIDVHLKSRLRRVMHSPTPSCWQWFGATVSGYGYISINDRRTLTHRLAYELWVGPIPEGMYVLHHCDNRKCCKPSHLFLGTQADNLHDMWAKGRGKTPWPKGQPIPHRPHLAPRR